MFRKKLTAFALIFSLCIGGLIGCGKKETSSEQEINEQIDSLVEDTDNGKDSQGATMLPVFSKALNKELKGLGDLTPCMSEDEVYALIGEPDMCYGTEGYLKDDGGWNSNKYISINIDNSISCHTQYYMTSKNVTDWEDSTFRQYYANQVLKDHCVTVDQIKQYFNNEDINGECNDRALKGLTYQDFVKQVGSDGIIAVFQLYDSGDLRGQIHWLISDYTSVESYLGSEPNQTYNYRLYAYVDLATGEILEMDVSTIESIKSGYEDETQLMQYTW